MDFKTLRECAAAYNAVYDQELRQEIEEQQAFENWVNSLVEEGYDLSGYTWEDMYEAYIGEDLIGDVIRNRGKIGSAIQSVNKKASDAADKLGSGVASYASSLANPFKKPAAKPAAKPTPAAKPANEPYKSRFAGARDVAVKKAQAIKGSPVVGTKPAPTPAAKPAPSAPAAAKPAPTTSTASAEKPSAMDQWAKANPRLAQAQKIRQQGGSRAEVNKALYNKGTAAATSTPTVVKAGVDLFDIIQGYLLDEGYAETLQEAEWMMANLIDEEAIAIILGESALGTMAVLGGMAAGRAIHGKLQGRKEKKEREAKRRTSDYLGMKSRTKNVVARDRRASGDTRNEEFELWVNSLVEEGYDLSDYTWDEMYEFYLDEALTGERYKKVMKKPGGTAYSRKVSADPAKRATRGGKGGESDFGAGDRGSGNRAARRAGTYQDYNVNEAQHARENPEKYEAGEKKKYAPVRGERTPMPPRGDKRREEFEKWYAKQMGR